MADARAGFRLLAAVALAAVVLLGAAALAAATRVRYAVPALSDLLAACQRCLVPHDGAASVAVLVVGSLAVVVTIRMTGSAWRSWRDGRRFRRLLPLLGHLPEHPDVLVVDCRAPQAFCAGLLRPRTYVSTGALELLSPEQLRAVLAHEAHHARRRDPLRLLVIGALSDGLFFVPAVRQLGERYSRLAELAADEAAEAATAGKRALGGALLAFGAHPHPSAVSISPERVDRLLGRSHGRSISLPVLAGAAATLMAVGGLGARMLQATDGASVTLPVLAAQACMIAMAALPVAVGALALLDGRRWSNLVSPRP